MARSLETLKSFLSVLMKIKDMASRGHPGTHTPEGHGGSTMLKPFSQATLWTSHNPMRKWLTSPIPRAETEEQWQVTCARWHKQKWYVLESKGSTWPSQVALVVKNLSASAGDTDLIPGLGRSPGGGHGTSSILAWEILWTEEPGGRQSMQSQSLTRLSDFHFTFQFFHNVRNTS